MILQRMEIHHKARFAVATLALLVSVPLLAGDKVQITGSTSVLLPKPSEAIEASKRGNQHDGPSGRSEYQAGLPPVTPLLNTSPQANKKFLDALDKKKNWMFVNPYEKPKVEDYLQGEKATGLYNHRLMQGDEKSIVERFIQERTNDRANDTSRAPGDNPSARESDRTDLRTSFRAEDLNSPRQNNAKLDRGFALPPLIESRSFLSDRSERDDFERNSDRSPFSEGVFGATERPNDRAIFTPEEREARDAELNKIYQPRVTGAPGALGAVDPLNQSFDATRQEATPFSGRRSDQLFNFGRSEPASAASGRNSPSFSGPAVAGPGSGADFDRSGRRSFDINERAAQSSPFAPSVSATPAKPSSSVFAAPFVLPKPQRKF